jgi:hypothetical protein
VEDPPQPTTKTTGVRPQEQGLPPAPNPFYGDGRYGELQGQQPAPRNITNPIGPSRGRSSFDQGDERRAFSGQPGYGPPQPQYPQQGPATSFSQMDPSQAPLQIQTQRRPSMEQQQNYPRGPPYGAPHSAGPRTRSRSNDRAPAYPSQSYSNPASISSSPRTQEPSAKFPPRKSSLSQQTPPVIPLKDVSPQRSETNSSTAPAEPRERPGSAAAKPLPFIRPADIYKRVAEEKEKEREKERQSQESSRPSIDTPPAKSREESPSNPALRQRGSSESVGRGGPRTNLGLSEDQDPSGRMKPMLDPVAERKSEYGFENLLKSQASRENPTPPNEPLHISPPSETSKPSSPPERPELPSASSNYSDRSLEGSLPDVHRVSDFGTEFPGTSRDNSLRSSGQVPDQPSLPDLNLHHQPSYGYGSTVRQAFDNENRDVPPTPSSMGDSVVRSNSDSTSAISPIMSRGPGTAYTDHKAFVTAPAPTISEEPEQPRSRPASSGTIGKSLPPVDDSEPLPPPTRPGQGRNSPSPGSSPARRVVMNFNDNIPRSELAEMSTVTPTDSQHSDTEPGIETHDYDSYLSATAYAFPGSSVQSHKSLPDLPPTKARESPIPRSESPPKGAVRGLAGRFGQQGAPEPLRNMPTPMATPTATDTSRPSAAREQSFRPVLPGAWVSYANTPGESTPATEMRPSAHEPERDVVAPKTPELHVEAPFDPDTTPTAARKSAPAESETNSSMDPFAAAAAAGAALAGAFAVAPGLEKHEQDNPRPVRGDLDPSRHAPSNLNLPARGTQSSASSKPPTPPPKDTPAQQESPKPEQSYFPLPLRHKGEPSAEKSLTPQRSVVDGPLSIETPNEHQNDRLREEIMNTLTPRTSNVEGEDRLSFDHSRHNLNVAPTSREQVESTAIPREYESYWNESNEDAYPVPPILGKSEESAVAGAAAAAEPTFAERPNLESKDLPLLPAQTEGGLGQRPDGLPLIQHRFSWEATPPAEHPPLQESQVESGSPSTIRALNQPSTLSPSTPNTIRAINQPSALPQSSLSSPIGYGEERMADSQPHHEAAETLDAPRSTKEPAVESFVPGSTMPSGSSYEPVTQPTSTLQHEYQPSSEFKYLDSSRDSQDISHSDDLRSPHDPNLRQSLDNAPARSIQRSSISEPQRGSLDSARQNLASPTSVHEPRESLDAAQLSPVSPTNDLMSFKKILALKSPSERINAYNNTRQQFSAMDTGLENWIRSTGQAVPEHEELISANGRPISGSGPTHKPSPSRSKFPKIGGFDAGEAFRPSHARQSSGSFGASKITGQQVQAKSKDLLHTASVFGGKANTTAKGWLAKSKTRFRSSGGGDKVDM